MAGSPTLGSAQPASPARLPCRVLENVQAAESPLGSTPGGVCGSDTGSPEGRRRARRHSFGPGEEGSGQGRAGQRGQAGAPPVGISRWTLGTQQPTGGHVGEASAQNSEVPSAGGAEWRPAKAGAEPAWPALPPAALGLVRARWGSRGPGRGGGSSKGGPGQMLPEWAGVIDGNRDWKGGLFFRRGWG